MADSVDSTTLMLTDPTDSVRRLSPEQEFRLRVARNDPDRALELDLAGVPVFELAQTARALRSSLFNALAIIDDLTGGQL